MYIVDTRIEGNKLISDVPVVREFRDIFLDDFLGVPPLRQVEIRINLIPGVPLIGKALYCLAPPYMQELSSQLLELLGKRFIRSSSSLLRIEDLFDHLHGLSWFSKID